jgi:hypothetical protein
MHLAVASGFIPDARGVALSGGPPSVFRVVFRVVVRVVFQGVVRIVFQGVVRVVFRGVVGRVATGRCAFGGVLRGF